MEMHQIRYFLAVARTLNFTRAAEECNVAQPSLTRAVRKLEDELGGELFRRERSRTHLTELGRRMLEPLTRCYESALSAKADAAVYRSADVAPLRCGLSLSVTPHVIAPALASLTRAMPGLEIHLARGRADEILEQLEAGDIELAVAAHDMPGWDRIDRWELFSEPFAVYASASHPFAGRSSILCADLKRERIVMRPYCEHGHLLAQGACDAGGGNAVCGEAACEEDFLMLVTALRSAGVAPASAAMHAGRAEDGTQELLRIPIEEDFGNRSVALYAVAGRRYSPAASAFIRLLRAADWREWEKTLEAIDSPAP